MLFSLPITTEVSVPPTVGHPRTVPSPNFFENFYCVTLYDCFACISISAPCVPCSQRSEEGLDSLRRELQVVVNLPVSAEDTTCVLRSCSRLTLPNPDESWLSPLQPHKAVSRTQVTHRDTSASRPCPTAVQHPLLLLWVELIYLHGVPPSSENKVVTHHNYDLVPSQ